LILYIHRRDAESAEIDSIILWSIAAEKLPNRGVPVFLPRVLAAWMAAIKPPWMGSWRPSEGKPERPLLHQIN